MTLISKTLNTKNSKCSLIPFITAGYPSLQVTVEALYALDQKGADVIELGIPYSDALADGPIIQESSRKALQAGACVDKILYMLKTVSPYLNAPVVIFTYYNPVLARGIKKFIQDIACSGARGLIIPDLPLEEIDYILNVCTQFNIELILFIAPTSSETRMASILSKSSGCIYLVSSYGVTGIRNAISHKINKLAQKIKATSSNVIILGFGISNSEQISKIASWNVDGLVIGSAFMSIMLNKSDAEAIQSLSEACEIFKLAIDN